MGKAGATKITVEDVIRWKNSDNPAQTILDEGRSGLTVEKFLKGGYDSLLGNSEIVKEGFCQVPVEEWQRITEEYTRLKNQPQADTSSAARITELSTKLTTAEKQNADLQKQLDMDLHYIRLDAQQMFNLAMLFSKQEYWIMKKLGMPNSEAQLTLQKMQDAFLHTKPSGGANND